MEQQHEVRLDGRPESCPESKSESRKIPAAKEADNAASDEKDEGSASTGSFSSPLSREGATFYYYLVILLLGLSTAAAFLGLGISSAHQEQSDLFENASKDTAVNIQKAWEVYVDAASMIHNRCRDRTFSRQDFRDLYEYMVGNGLDFQAVQFDPNITHAERPAAEEEARLFYAENYPNLTYRGFVGFNYENETSLQPRNDAPFYFPIHYMEPVEGNQAAIDLDYHASGSRQRTVLYCMEKELPALTDRLRLVQETEEIAYGVVLMHPGIELEGHPEETWPKDLASIVIRIPDLLKRSTLQGVTSQVYLYDRSDSSTGTGEPLFLGGVHVAANEGGDDGTVRWLPEVPMDDLLATTDRRQMTFTEDVMAANKLWAVVIVQVPGTFEADLVFVCLGGATIALASVLLVVFLVGHNRHMRKINEEREQSESERASLILENARQAAKAERELNDFISHEVRNPVAAALAACSFVKTEVNREPPLATQDSKETTRDDVNTIENALKFVSDLLRNMLDMHRATSKQLKVQLAPTDIVHDVLQPVDGILYQRGGKVEVIVESEENLFVMSDRLRLKQIMLNLGRNSAKFVDEGFIRLTAKVVEGSVQLSVEDSGPGIPVEKRAHLFNKYQESLDLLSQGTGVGLFLCKQLVGLMGGTIRLDESYDSGVPGRPGSRFIIDLRQPPIDGIDLARHLSDQDELEFESEDTKRADEEAKMGAATLPQDLAALFVDDDPVLRKLFSRCIRTVAPDWKIREAASGEAALRLIEDEHFDLIFMDMYMAAVEKQMLGVEAVEALRARGFEGRICGLSANDKEQEFLAAGANAFTTKPFPCERRALTVELHRILMGGEKPKDGDEMV